MNATLKTIPNDITNVAVRCATRVCMVLYSLLTINQRFRVSVFCHLVTKKTSYLNTVEEGNEFWSLNSSSQAFLNTFRILCYENTPPQLDPRSIIYHVINNNGIQSQHRYLNTRIITMLINLHNNYFAYP